MKLRPMLFSAAIALGFAVGIFSAVAQSSNVVATAPVYVPDYSHASQPLPEGNLAWDAEKKELTVTNGQDFARFTFSFTNVTAGNITVLNVHPGCGCTTAELPPIPWTIPAGATGQIHLTVNLAGKTAVPGMLAKYVNVSTDKGSKMLYLVIRVLSAPPMPEMTEAQRDAGIAAAKVDRQAIFKNDCASCHVNKVEGKYGQQLFDAVCAVCHEAKDRATMVPDLHHLKVPTNEEFWRTWITYGKPGSLMPAFATSQGGPLTDMQIASLAAFLNATIPSHVAPLQ
jgi:mono/diheme cytochrome c family protein